MATKKAGKPSPRKGSAPKASEKGKTRSILLTTDADEVRLALADGTSSAAKGKQRRARPLSQLTEVAKEEVFLDLWRRHAAVRASVRKIALLASSTGWRIAPRPGWENPDPAGKEFLRRKFEEPNRNRTLREMVFATLARMKLTGRSAWEVTHYSDGSPAEFIFLPGTVLPQVDTNGEFLTPAYTQNYRGSRAEFVERDVIFFTVPDPDDVILGSSDIESVEVSLLSDIYAGAWLRNFYRNDARKTALFKLPANLSEEAFQRAKKEIEVKLMGVQSAHKPAVVLQGECEVESLDHAPKDLGVLEERRAYRNEVFAVIGTNPSKMGFRDGQTGGDPVYDDRAFAVEEIRPTMGFMEERINAHLWKYGPEALKGWAFRFLPPLPTDLRQTARLADVAARRGLITLNEGRESMGYQPIEGGDILIPPQTPGLENASPIVDIGGGGTEYEPEEEGATLAARKPVTLDDQIGAFESGWKDAIRSLRADFNAKVEKKWPITDADADLILKGFGTEELTEFLYESLTATWKNGRAEAGRETREEATLARGKGQVSKAAGTREKSRRRAPKSEKELPELDRATAKALRARAVDLGDVMARHLRYGDKATSWYLRNRLAEAVKKNMSLSETIEYVGELFTEYEEWRLERLVRTEITKAWQEAKLSISGDRGITRAEIRLGSRPCEWCLENAPRVETVGDARAYMAAHHHINDCSVVLRADLPAISRPALHFIPKR